MTHTCARSYGQKRCDSLLKRFAAHRAHGGKALYHELNWGSLEIEWSTKASQPGVAADSHDCDLCPSEEGLVDVCRAEVRASVRGEDGEPVLGYTTSTCDRCGTERRCTVFINEPL